MVVTEAVRWRPRRHPRLSEHICKSQFVHSDRDPLEQTVPLGDFSPLEDLLFLTQVEGHTHTP